MCASSVHGLQGLAQGVEVYPGFAGASLVYGNQGEVRGVTTNEVGLDKQGYMEAGMRFRYPTSEGAVGASKHRRRRPPSTSLSVV